MRSWIGNDLFHNSRVSNTGRTCAQNRRQIQQDAADTDRAQSFRLALPAQASLSDEEICKMDSRFADCDRIVDPGEDVADKKLDRFIDRLGSAARARWRNRLHHCLRARYRPVSSWMDLHGKRRS